MKITAALLNKLHHEFQDNATAFDEWDFIARRINELQSIIEKREKYLQALDFHEKGIAKACDDMKALQSICGHELLDEFYEMDERWKTCLLCGEKL